MTATITDTATARMMIRAAYYSLGKEWAGLAEIRDELPSLERDEIDAALRAMVTEPGVHIAPVANLKGLSQADRDAALRLGGQDNHAIMIEG